MKDFHLRVFDTSSTICYLLKITRWVIRISDIEGSPSMKKSSEPQNTTKKVKTAAMRHPALYILSIIILVVVFVAFILGPVLGEAAAGTPGGVVFGSYKGRSIRYQAGSFFVRSYESQYQQVQNQAQQAGREVGLQDVYSAIKNAYDSTVFRYGLLDMAEDAGLSISTQEITETLATAERFRDEQGNFSSELLRNALSAEPGLNNEVREDLITAKIQNDLLESGRLSDAEIQFISDMGENRRTFDLVSFSFDDYPDTEVISYLEENPTPFQSIELSSITMNSLNEAEQIRERLNNREASFEDLAQSSSVDIYAEEGGSRGLVWYHNIQRDFEDPETTDLLFSLVPGQVSEIFQIRDEKYVIYRADSEASQPGADDPAVIEQVRNHVSSFERGRISDYFRAEADGFILLSDGIGWASAIAARGLSPVTTNPIAINHGDNPLFPTLETASLGLLTGASTRESLLVSMFSLEQGELSEPVELRDKIVIIRYNSPAEQDEGQSEFLKLYLPYLAQDYLIAELQRLFSSPENLKDNFDATFQESFLQN